MLPYALQLQRDYNEQNVFPPHMIGSNIVNFVRIESCKLFNSYVIFVDPQICEYCNKLETVGHPRTS